MSYHVRRMTTRISSKGQIAIPKPIREQLDLREGTEVSLEIRGHLLILKPVHREHPDWRTLPKDLGVTGLTEARAQDRKWELAKERAESSR
jgi:AbrB family looped-hinge helix DNA binding protein